MFSATKYGQRLFTWRANLFCFLCRGVILMLLAQSIIRLVWFDEWTLFVWANMLTPYVYLPAYGIGFLAWRQRHYRLTALAAIVIVFHIWQLSPQLLTTTTLQAAETPGATLRLFSMNLTADNQEVAALVDEIEAEQPDVLFFQEYTTMWHTALSQQGLLQAYPYGMKEIDGKRYGTAIWSKYPITTDQREIKDTTLLFASLELNGRPLQLLTLHLPGLQRDFARWDARMAAVTDVLLQTSGPLVAIGDYNQTIYNRWYQEMTNGRLRDAHQTCNDPWAVSWPNGTLFAPGVLLDHALLSPEIGCLQVREGRGEGSEHKPILLDIVLLPELPDPQSR
jgi:endonuclease/exonuclease/phosphatase (EEP) superfamily protein YafD